MQLLTCALTAFVVILSMSAGATTPTSDDGVTDPAFDSRDVPSPPERSMSVGSVHTESHDRDVDTKDLDWRDGDERGFGQSLRNVLGRGEEALPRAFKANVAERAVLPEQPSGQQEMARSIPSRLWKWVKPSSAKKQHVNLYAEDGKEYMWLNLMERGEVHSSQPTPPR